MDSIRDSEVSYLDSVFEEYKKDISDFVSGYFVLLDIIDSTYRKDDVKYRWIKQTKLLYQSIDRLKKHLTEKLGIKEEENIFLKTVGDSSFIFIAYKHGSVPTPKTSGVILQSILAFNDFFYDSEFNY